MSTQGHSRSDYEMMSTTGRDKRRRTSPLIKISGKNKLVFRNCGNVKLRYSSRNTGSVRDCHSGGLTTPAQIIRHHLHFISELHTDIGALLSLLAQRAEANAAIQEQFSTRQMSRGGPECSLMGGTHQVSNHQSSLSKSEVKRCGNGGRLPHHRKHAPTASEQQGHAEHANKNQKGKQDRIPPQARPGTPFDGA
jgi:hypothetical protein